jgi:TonB family protein
VRTRATEKFDVALDHVTDNMQVVVITQSGSALLSSLADFALQNARKSDPNSMITAVENRVVNRHELVCVTYESTLKAGPMTFYGYLYSEDQGTVEVIAMAPSDFFQNYRAELTELLNGLEILPAGTPLTEALTGPQAAGPEDMVEIDPSVLRQPKKPALTGLPQGVSPPALVAQQVNGAGASQSQEVPVEAVHIGGNRRIPESAVRTWITTREGDPYNPATLDRDVRAIYAQGYFQDVKVFAEDGTRGGKIVTFEVVELNGAGSGSSVPGAGRGNSSDGRPVPLNKPRPNYTEDARRARVEGIVRIRALVGANGSVRDVRLLTHLPDGLDEEAILAVKQMQFKPAMKDNEPVAFWVTIEVEFNMCGNCVPARPK